MDPARRTSSFGGFGMPSSPMGFSPGGYPSTPVTPPVVEVVDPVMDFMKGNLHTPLLQLRAEDVPQNFEGLRQLASCWSWKEVARLSEHCVLNLPNFPHQRIQWRFAQAFALAKMQMIDEAADVLEKNVLRCTAEQNRYETYENYYPQRKGCMVPFALRLLYARLPLMKPDPQQAQGRLYDLLDFCCQQRAQSSPGAALQSSTTTPSPCGPVALEEGLGDDSEADAEWKARERRVKLELVNSHMLLHQHICAISILNDLLKECTPEMRRSTPRGQLEYIELLQRLGSVHLEAGQISPAEDAFSRVEAIDENTLSPEEQEQLTVAMAMNQGLLCIAQQNYTEGYEGFAEILRKDPTNVEAANNQAICALYSCNLSDGVTILESLIRADPRKALTEPVVFNLCSLYDLQSEQSIHKKKVLQAVVQRYKGDFFPAKYFRLE